MKKTQNKAFKQYTSKYNQIYYNVKGQFIDENI